MYKFLTFIALFVLITGAMLTFNKNLDGQTSILALVITYLVAFILATRLSNIIDKYDQTPVEKLDN